MTTPGSASNATPEERQWSMFAWVGFLLFGFLGPLVVMLTKGKESDFVRRNSVEALNFSIALLFGYVIAFVLFFVFIGILLFIALIVLTYVFGIIGAMKTYGGEEYRLPFNIRLVK